MCLGGFCPVHSDTEHWGTKTKCSSGQNIRDLDDPKPTGVFLFLASCLDLDRLERGVLNFTLQYPREWMGTPRGAALPWEDRAVTEQLCIDPTAWQGQTWVRGCCCWGPWRASGEKYPLWMILECISVGITPALSTRVWRTPLWRPCSVGKHWWLWGEQRVRRSRWDSLSCLHLQQPHKMPSPHSETQLEVTLLLTLHFQSRGLGTSPNP